MGGGGGALYITHGEIWVILVGSLAMDASDALDVDADETAKAGSGLGISGITCVMVYAQFGNTGGAGETGV